MHIPFLLFLPLTLALLLSPLVLVLLARTAHPDDELGPATAAARRHAVTGGAIAVVAATGAALALSYVLLGGPGPALELLLPGAYVAVAAVPALAAVVHTGVLALTEVSWPRPRGEVRCATLAARTLPDVTPRVLHRSWLTLVLVLLAVLALAALSAAPDGVSIEAEVTRDGVVVGSRGHGPYPGLPFGIAAASAVLLLVAAVEGTLRLVLDRPAVAGADTGTDTALRRASAHRVLRGAAAGTLLTLGPVLVSVAGGVSSVRPGSPLQALSWAALVLGVLAALAGLLVLFWVAPRVPAPTGPPVLVGEPTR